MKQLTPWPVESTIMVALPYRAYPAATRFLPGCRASFSLGSSSVHLGKIWENILLNKLDICTDYMMLLGKYWFLWEAACVLLCKSLEMSMLLYSNFESPNKTNSYISNRVYILTNSTFKAWTHFIPFYKLQRWSRWKPGSQCWRIHPEDRSRPHIYP